MKECHDNVPRHVERAYQDCLLKPVIHPILVKRAEGVFLYDERGTRYLDLTAGFGVSLLGHGTYLSEHVKGVMIRQMERLIHATHYLYYVEPVAALAEKLLSIAPGSLKRVFFCNSGSEGVEGAIRAVRKTTRRHELLALQRGFMGRTMGALSLTGSAEDKRGAGPLLPGVHHLPPPYCYRCALGHTSPACNTACSLYARHFLEHGTAGDIAAFVFEPILGDAGVVVPPDDYYRNMIGLCKERGIALVADETLTGLGRTGRVLACNHWGIEPDVLVLGKALGAGLPLGAYLVSHDIAESFQYHDFSSTTGGNPVACAGGLACLEVLEEEGLVQRAAALGQTLIDRLRMLGIRHRWIGEVRGRGLLIGIEVSDPTTGSPAPQQARWIQGVLREQGILLTVYGASTLRISPPLVIEEHELQQFLDVLERALVRLDSEEGVSL